MTLKAFKYRFYPNSEQKILLAKSFGCCRFIYNKMLDLRKKSYKAGVKLKYKDTSKELTRLKREEDTCWLNEVSSVGLQQSLRHLDSAYLRFFKKQGGYPKFKKRTNTQSLSLMSSAFRYSGGQLWIAKCKDPLDIKWSQRFNGTPSSLTISKDCGDRYFVSLLVETQIKPLKKNKKVVGIDLGLTSIVTLNTGKKIKAPKITKKYEKKLATAQKSLSRKQKDSSNRNKDRLRVARIHNKISDSRKDFTHKLTTKLIHENQVIYLESLGTRELLGKRKLSKEISDVNWGEITRQLEYKALWYGRTLVKVDRYFPSTKTCSHCGHILKDLRLEVRKWRCPQCNSLHDRDINAAKNILAEGHSVIARGENVRPLSTRKSYKKAVFVEAGIPVL